MSVTGSRERCFELQLQPTLSGDDWGFRLSETFGDAKDAVAKVDAGRAGQFRRAVLEAVQARVTRRLPCLRGGAVPSTCSRVLEFGWR